MNNSQEHITKKITLKGILIADDFDDDGEPVAFALLTDDEEKYRIMPTASNQQVELKGFQKQKVKAYGKVLIIEDLKIFYIEGIVVETVPPENEND